MSNASSDTIILCGARAWRVSPCAAGAHRTAAQHASARVCGAVRSAPVQACESARNRRVGRLGRSVGRTSALCGSAQAAAPAAGAARTAASAGPPSLRARKRAMRASGAPRRARTHTTRFCLRRGRRVCECECVCAWARTDGGHERLVQPGGHQPAVQRGQRLQQHGGDGVRVDEPRRRCVQVCVARSHRTHARVRAASGRVSGTWAPRRRRWVRRGCPAGRGRGGVAPRIRQRRGARSPRFLKWARPQRLAAASLNGARLWRTR